MNSIWKHAIACAVGSIFIPTAVHASLLSDASPARVKAACDQALRTLAKETAFLESPAASKLSSQARILALNRLAHRTMVIDGEASILGGVHPDKAVRDAAEACSVAVTNDQVARQQRPKLYALIRGIKPADAVQTKLQKDWIESFEDTGVALPEDKKARFKAVSDEMTTLGQEYDRNIRESTGKVPMTEAELKGLPEAVKAGLKRDDQGNYLLGFSYPEYDPFMTLAEDGAARARYALAFAARGGQRNIDILARSLVLRQELAGLIGQANFSAMTVRRRMAGTPEAVEKFLAQVKTAVEQSARSEIQSIREEKAKHLNIALEQVSALRTDYAFYEERIRKARFAIDQEALRAYFPTEASVQWILDVSSSLYGIRFEEIKEKLWHGEARTLKVSDRASKRVLGHIHLDLFPRDGKYNHAAVFPIVYASTVIKQLPRAALVTNFNRVGLDQRELETLVHEFGHALHSILSQTRYIDQGGTSVERDFVEAPSQMFEEWARRKESLQGITKFCKGCPAVTDEMIKRLEQARQYGQGLRYARQYQYASYDLALNVRPGADPMELWRQSETAMPWGYNGNLFPTQFGHLIGYASAYYGYMWSEVLALDMLSAYGNNVMDEKVGMRYRQTILGRGSEVPAAQMVREFLGREPNTDAFFKEITGQRMQ
jgi:thimet oligopeptidase